MASQHKHRQRVIRGADDRLWEDLDAAAQATESDRSAITRQLWEWFVGRPGAKLPARPAEDPPEPASTTDQLIARIRSEGGVWDGKRALEACQELGFYCTIQRARQILRKLAEQNLGLLTAVEGKRWTYEAADATEES
jgi:hypothetical protein